MEAWLAWARGPLFRAAFAFMILGLLRHVGLTVWEMARAMRRAGDKSLPARAIVKATVRWLFPVRQLRNRTLFSATTLLFHISILLVPIFLVGHVALWRQGLGISWPALPNSVADVLTLLAIVAAVALVVERAAPVDARSLSRFQDYALPLVIAVPFVSGFLAMHPALNPFRFESTLLVHVLSADLVMILIPVTKVAHCVLLPATQWVSEVGWHFPPDAGSRLAATLGKENEKI
jgi:hypothetical protein